MSRVLALLWRCREDASMARGRDRKGWTCRLPHGRKPLSQGAEHRPWGCRGQRASVQLCGCIAAAIAAARLVDDADSVDGRACGIVVRWHVPAPPMDL
jgi:hypothetical protein